MAVAADANERPAATVTAMQTKRTPPLRIASLAFGLEILLAALTRFLASYR
jgi:hypothetical protein